MDARELAKSIRAHVDIVGVVQKELTLKPVGKNFRGLCPFHQEKTPSFYVHPTSKRFHCYGCHLGGDAITFVEKTRGVGFFDACRSLIEEFSLPLSVDFSVKRGTRSKRDLDVMLRIQKFAAEFFSRRVNDISEVKQYLVERRGLTQEAISFFGFGASTWRQRDAFVMALRKKIAGHPDELLLLKNAEQLGLWTKRGGHLEDRFVDRLMIPIHDERGNVVGFSSRTIMDREGAPKYMNSPESEVFQKRNLLYGFFQNKEWIRKSREIILVEGFFDVVRLWQVGIRNACATMGTTLSEYWIKRLSKIVHKATLVFDGDAAGLEAMAKLAPLFFQFSWEPRVVVLPRGMDPDEFVRKRGKAVFDELFRNSKLFFDFYFLHQFQKVKHSYFDVVNLIERLMTTLAKNCPYGVALSRIESYLDIADLGVQTQDVFLSHLKRLARKKPHGSRRQDLSARQKRGHSGLFGDDAWIRTCREEFHLLQLAIYDLEFVSELCPLVGRLLKEKAICDLIVSLHESKEVLAKIPEFNDRVRFLQYSYPDEPVARRLFGRLAGLDEKNLQQQSVRQQVFRAWVDKLRRRKERASRKMKLLEFRQQYSGGAMSWEETMAVLEEMQKKGQ